VVALVWSRQKYGPRLTHEQIEDGHYRARCPRTDCTYEELYTVADIREVRRRFG